MTIYGWDASHYDQVPDAARLIAEGFSFMTHKAGGDANDADLAAWWAATEKHRGELLLGTYWVLLPGGPVARADAFLARLDGQCPGWRDGPFILQADCEKWNNNPATVPGRADITAFCDRLAERVPKLRPIVYAPKWVYGDTLTGLGYPLWASAYVTGAGTAASLYPGDSSSKWAAYSGQTPAILQFTDAATIAGQSTCDANAYRGTLAQLLALVAPGWTEDQMELTDKYGDTAWPGRTVQNRLKDDAMLRDVWWGDPQGTKAAQLPAGSPLAKVIALPAQVAALTAAVTALSGKDFTDESAIIAGVLAGLSPEKIAEAIPQDIAAEVADILAQRLSS